ncbi:DUF2607 family protein [Vibrio sp.]|uniref:DUF2607 family protein n=1 Tax=Vibrio sp. TaxID=678 RepID=UPI003D10A808
MLIRLLAKPSHRLLFLLAGIVLIAWLNLVFLNHQLEVSNTGHQHQCQLVNVAQHGSCPAPLVWADLSLPDSATTAELYLTLTTYAQQARARSPPVS